MNLVQMLNVISSALDRLAAGESFNTVVEATGVTALVAKARNDLFKYNAALPAMALLSMTNDLDDYLREIRAENLDGSEPELGELLEKAFALRLECAPIAAASKATGIVPSTRLSIDGKESVDHADGITVTESHVGSPDAASVVAVIEKISRWDYLVADNATPPHCALLKGGEKVVVAELPYQDQIIDMAQRLNQADQATSLLCFMANDPSCLAMSGDNLAEWKSIESQIKPIQLSASRVQDGAEYFPGACVEGIGSVMMQDVVGDYDTPDTVPEWAWVERVASFNHGKNGIDGIWEFVLNLSCNFENVPEKLKPVMAEAKSKNLAYLIFHQGT